MTEFHYHIFVTGDPSQTELGFIYTCLENGGQIHLSGLIFHEEVRMNEGGTGHPGQPEGENSIVRSTNDSNKGSPGLGWGTKF